MNTYSSNKIRKTQSEHLNSEHRFSKFKLSVVADSLIFWCLYPLHFDVETIGVNHGLRRPSGGINQRKLKIWADAADKICFGRT